VYVWWEVFAGDRTLARFTELDVTQNTGKYRGEVQGLQWLALDSETAVSPTPNIGTFQFLALCIDTGVVGIPLAHLLGVLPQSLYERAAIGFRSTGGRQDLEGSTLKE